MKLARRRTEEPDLNIINLVDVVLVLLVFFMLTSTFERRADIRIDLPKSEAPATNANAVLEVTVDAKGNYYFGAREVAAGESRDVLKRALAADAGGNFKRPLTIRADARTTHQSVVTVMDVAGQLGFTQLNIVTTHSQ
ncbi:MAG TPA: biopolymer transporter ExbD [Gammaproteobacteria bacterium]|jgi:biopolymer transport protein ExbD|nr:biopolymer transporter ExbD [Gammaproteobacteria bacterium]